MTLNDLKVGQSGVITAVGGEGALRLRLLDLWECHKQFLGLAKPKRELTIDDVIPYGI